MENVMLPMIFAGVEREEKARLPKMMMPGIIQPADAVP